VTKTCKTCGLEKELSEFYPKKHGAHGVRANCKICEEVKRAKERLDNLEESKAKEKESSRKFREDNPEYVKNYYQSHREQCIESSIRSLNVVVEIIDGREFNRRKIQHYRQRYNLSIEQIRELYSTRNCPICGVPFSGMDIKSLHVDHDHVTGKVRGLLCLNCNWLIGHAKEDPGTLERAAQYLRNHQENQ